MPNHPQVRVVEELADTRALILHANHSFLAETISETLAFLGCDVDTKPTHGRRYDYLLILGLPKNIHKTLQKKTPRFPFEDLLKDHGKALIVLTDAKEAEKVANTHIKRFILSEAKTFSPPALSQKILNTLFTSKPIRISHENSNKYNKANEIPISHTPHRNRRKSTARLFLLILSVFLFLSPLIVFAGTSMASAFFIRKTITADIPVSQRREHASRAVFSASIAEKSGSFLESLAAPFSPDISNTVGGGSEALYQVSLALEEGLILEETLRKVIPGMLAEGKPEGFSEELPIVQSQLTSIENHLKDAVEGSKDVSLLKKHNITPRLEEARSYTAQAKEAVTLLPEFLAFGKEKKYLLLFQNNFELRPTGGFIGSFGIMTVSNGRITDLSVEDVYEADGQLKGHVEPPLPIKTHLNQPNWFLRDSNWDPDFLASASQAEWFLEKEREEKVDGVVAVDLYFVKSLLSALGGVYVPDYQARVTADDFFIKLQSDTHDSFFPGSNEKKDLLSSLLTALTIELKDRKTIPYYELMRALVTSLSEKHVLVYLHHGKSQETIEKLGWGGRLISQSANQSSIAPVVLDYLMLVEANVGVNKANYYIERELLTTVAGDGKNILRELTIYYKNKSPLTKGVFTGHYKNYLRILLPPQAEVKEVLTGSSKLIPQEDVTISSAADKLSVGFLVEVPETQEKKVLLRYLLPQPVAKQFSYYLIVQKQPGTDRDPFVFKTIDSPGWDITTSTIPALPYLNNLAVDRLLSLDFAQANE